jgi:hypothetical protein
MATAQTDQPAMLVFQDQTGDYYLLPREVLDEYRAPAEQKAEVERALAAANPTAGVSPDDTDGFLGPLGFVLIGIAVAASQMTVVATVAKK